MHKKLAPSDRLTATPKVLRHPVAFRGRVHAPDVAPDAGARRYVFRANPRALTGELSATGGVRHAGGGEVVVGEVRPMLEG